MDTEASISDVSYGIGLCSATGGLTRGLVQMPLRPMAIALPGGLGDSFPCYLGPLVSQPRRFPHRMLGRDG